MRLTVKRTNPGSRRCIALRSSTLWPNSKIKPLSERSRAPASRPTSVMGLYPRELLRSWPARTKALKALSSSASPASILRQAENVRKKCYCKKVSVSAGSCQRSTRILMASVVWYSYRSMLGLPRNPRSQNGSSRTRTVISRAPPPV